MMPPDPVPCRDAEMRGGARLIEEDADREPAGEGEGGPHTIKMREGLTRLIEEDVDRELAGGGAVRHDLGVCEGRGAKGTHTMF